MSIPYSKQNIHNSDFNIIKKTLKNEFLTGGIMVKNFETKIENETLNFNKYANEFFAVNFYASWCAPCRVEAPIIEELSKIIPIVGIAYKDKVLNTKKFLDNYGNPYNQIGLDASGKIAIEWGVYGVPETFLINTNGKIIYRHAGPLLYNVFKSEVLPLVRKKH